MALAAAGQKLLWTKSTAPPPSGVDDGKKHWPTGTGSSSFIFWLAVLLKAFE